MGCGYYTAQHHPVDLVDRPEGQITDELVSELENGVGSTGIRPGVIGEIGMSWPSSPTENKVLRAAARAQKITGAALIIHPGRNSLAPLEHLRVVEGAGGEIDRCVISHVERTLFAVRDMQELARSGAFIEFDLFGVESSYYSLMPIDMPNDAMRVDYMRALADCGHLHQLLISQDICHKTRLSAFGGEGYAHILKRVIPLLRRKGFSEADVDLLHRVNPARMLTWR
jgi:phosphotriesterase-related protein